MGLIKIKRNRCPKKKEDDDKKKECKGTFVPIIKMLALAWIVSLGLLILTVVINLFVLLFSFAYYKNKKESKENPMQFFKVMQKLLNWSVSITEGIFLILTCLFLVLYAICLIIDFLLKKSPFVIVVLPQITFFIIFFEPICCALWEAGIFAIIEALVKALFGDDNFDLGRIFSLERLRKVANNESDDESIKTFFSMPESPVKVNIIDDSDTSNTNSNTVPKFPIDDKMKQIEYQNCLAKYKEESSVDSSTAFVLN